jgi:5-methylcytosine-specific restriction endonuclease McrA
MPCVICGDSGDIEIDHITPVSQGGGSERANLQPLCRQCHCRKGRKRGRTNAELRALYLADAFEHHLVNRYRLAIRFMNFFDAPSFGQWKANHA